MFEIPMVEAPRNCSDCAAASPLKKEGCAYDIGQRLKDVAHAMAESGIDVSPTKPLFEELKSSCSECLAGMEDHAESSNQLRHTARLVAEILAQGAIQVAPRAPVAEPPAATQPDPAPSQAPAEHPGPAPTPPVSLLPGAPPAATGPVHRPPRPDHRLSREYIFPEHEALEGQLVADVDTNSVCIRPKLRVDNYESYVEEILTPLFEEDPFEGLQAAIPKLHRKKCAACQELGKRFRTYCDECGIRDDLCSVTAYYHGPSGPDAHRMLRERLGILVKTSRSPSEPQQGAVVDIDEAPVQEEVGENEEELNA